MSDERLDGELEAQLRGLSVGPLRAPSPGGFLREVRRRGQRRLMVRLVPLAFGAAAAGMLAASVLSRILSRVPVNPLGGTGGVPVATNTPATREMPTLASFRAIVESGDASVAPFPIPADAGDAVREIARSSPLASSGGL